MEIQDFRQLSSHYALGKFLMSFPKIATDNSLLWDACSLLVDNKTKASLKKYETCKSSKVEEWINRN
jgi:hypothetical protein